MIQLSGYARLDTLGGVPPPSRTWRSGLPPESICNEKKPRVSDKPERR